MGEVPAPGLWRRALHHPFARVLSAVAGGIVLVILFQRVELRDVLREARAIGPWPLLGALLLMVGACAMGALRWSLLLGACGATRVPRLPVLLRHVLTSIFWSSLPSGMAGDLYRGFLTRELVPRPELSFLIVALERVLGLLALVLLTFVSVAEWPLPVPSPLRGGPGAPVLTACSALGVLAVIGFGLSRMPGMLGRVARTRFLQRLGALLEGVGSPRQLLLPFLLSVASQAAIALAAHVIIAAFHPGLPLLVSARLMPAILLLTVLPVTPGGLGQRELVFIHLYGGAGVPASSSMAASLLFLMASLSVAVLGGLLHVSERLLLSLRHRS